MLVFEVEASRGGQDDLGYCEVLFPEVGLYDRTRTHTVEKSTAQMVVAHVLQGRIPISLGYQIHPHPTHFKSID